jgi:uncharacterized protein YjaZ
MSIKLHILNESGRLAPYVGVIQQAYDEVIVKLKNKITLPNVDVVIADSPDGAIPETGVGGNAYTAHIIFISINPNFHNLDKTISNEIKGTLAHELHHCARMKTIGYGTSLLQALITEGLADHFDLEVNGTEPKPWSIAIQGGKLEEIRKIAEKSFNDSTYNHFNWFFGSKDLGIPKWAGYSIGFDIVKNYLIKIGKKPSELVSVDASEFIK